MTNQAKSKGRKEPLGTKRDRVQQIIDILDKTYPNTTLALNFSTPFELLIALILAAQCSDEFVNQKTTELFKKYRTPQEWANVDRGTLEEEIRPVTFFRNKTKSIQTCCLVLIDRFESTVPNNLEELVSLPGVGRKTANIIRGNAFGQAFYWSRSTCWPTRPAFGTQQGNEPRQN